jgi:HD-GYP domain-containing protein (c-di-GMP phosphodiesterase class II)
MKPTTGGLRPIRLATRATQAFSHLHHLAYAHIAPDMTIVQASTNFWAVLTNPRLPLEGNFLTDFLDEFVGAEEMLQFVLRGVMPSYQLERVRREDPDGSVRFLDFHILPLDEYHISQGLLLLVEDTTPSGQLGQNLLQSRNELHLMRDALVRAYAELQRLADSDLKTAEDALRAAHIDLRNAYDLTMEGWVRALDLRDHETEGHSLRVAEMTVTLARAMCISEAELIHIRRGALLHDIGKIGIPDAILLKVGELTAEERKAIEQHPVYAYEILLPIIYLHPALDIPYGHHEKWDGSGYPRGLKGEEIPLAARLFAVVDVWDALRSDRPYRRSWPEVQVREYVRTMSGTQFDPAVVEVFMRVVDELMEERGIFG